MGIDLTGLPSTRNYTANDLATLGGKGMDPLIGSALIGLGGNLLKGLFSKSDEEKYREQAEANYDLTKKKQDLMRSNVKSDLMPKTPRYMSSQHMPLLDSMMKKVLVGRMGKQFGSSMGDWGVDMSSIFDYLSPGGAEPKAQTPSFPGGRFRGPLADERMAGDIMGKYGMGGRGMGGGRMIA